MRFHLRCFVSAIVLAAPTFALLYASCNHKGTYETTFYRMGGIPVKIKAYNVSKSDFVAAVKQIKKRLTHLEKVLSIHDSSSQLSMLNRTGKGVLPPDALELLRLALKVSAQTAGAFDPTIKPVLSLWNTARERGYPPTPTELQVALSHVGWKQISISGNTVSLNNSSATLDLGGVAKGYMADQAIKILKSHHISRAIVDTGGDLSLMNPPNEPDFKIGIKDPKKPAKIFGILEIHTGAVATSGCYERYLEIKGQKYCHIVNPLNGIPVTELASVTIVARDSATADALATACMVLGRKKAKDLVQSLPDVEGVIIWQSEGTDQLQWWLSPGLRGRFKRTTTP